MGISVSSLVYCEQQEQISIGKGGMRYIDLCSFKTYANFEEFI
ncbi:hypothetical protein CEAHHEIO_00196 [Monkeypox virus]|uniref:Uncharacterized protein n=1 Tax=Monkeypox virus TaxID=10244 RepID=A0A650BUE6_MONPV|nr:hypothetical protein PDLMKLCO_00195 [Monkeypox virus]URK21253.1 hypothetical protein MPXV-SI-2022V502225_00197 [Monkeypox virus]URK21444.1 hypothetical protein MPXV-SI-2022V52144_00197 [Monkeypox virus]URZ86279.1 hypothetical protein CEAHHEIO_00196 [Monkeypox virus]USE04250.1 hypothetical protein MPXV_SI2022_S3_00198 [Monkeypox virus]